MQELGQKKAPRGNGRQDDTGTCSSRRHYAPRLDTCQVTSRPTTSDNPTHRSSRHTTVMPTVHGCSSVAIPVAEVTDSNAQPSAVCPGGVAGREASARQGNGRNSAELDAPFSIGRIRAENIIEVFELGTTVTARRGIVSKHSGGGKRSGITGFTKQSAARLRRFCVENHVPNYVVYATTLTLHESVTPDQWRSIMQRYRNMVKYRGGAGVWRVELQKRKVPHLHCIFWLPTADDFWWVVHGWLKASRQETDKDAVRFGIRGRPVEDEGWIIYCALHNAKPTQAGWIGKQWGVWNRGLFKNRPALRLGLSDGEHARFLRRLRAYSRAEGGRKTRYMGRGHNFRRLIKGSTVKQLLRGLETVEAD